MVICLTLLGHVLALRQINPKVPTGRAVIDQVGNEITIPLPFQGATPLFQGIGEYLYVTRDPGSIQDSQTVSLNWLGRSFFLNLYPQLHTLRHDISLLDQQAANQERLLRLHPSAIFVSSNVAEPLRRVGLPALGLTQVWSNDQVFDRTRVFTQALGQPDRAAALVKDFQRDMADLRQELGVVPPQEQPKVAELFILPSGVIFEIGNSETERDAFDVAGVVNASSHEHSTKVGVEAVLRLNPDSILLLPDPTPSPRMFMADARWEALGAVRRQSVYRRPLGANGGFKSIIEYPLFARWLAELNHSDRLAPHLRAKVVKKMLTQFGYRLSEVELDAFLNLSENGASAGYARFAVPAP